MSSPPENDAAGSIRGTRVERRQIEAADCPLAALGSEHFLQRQHLSEIELLATADTPEVALARAILRNLCHDLPLHHADEDESLFPRLRRRARPEDEIDRLLDTLVADHRTSQRAIERLLPALICTVEGALPTTEDRAALSALAKAKRRHLIFENAIVLPLAQIRLNAADRQAMRTEMRNRRLGPPAACAACKEPYQICIGPTRS